MGEVSETAAPPEHDLAPPPGRVHTFRFALLYGALAAVLVVGVVGVVILIRQPAPPKPKPWSAWRPKAGTVTKMTQEIADYVAPRYVMNKKGDQLVTILPGDPEVTRGTQVTKIAAIGFLRSANAQDLSRVVRT